MDEYPALFLNEPQRSRVLRRSMIVVGGVDSDGNRSPYSQGEGDEITVYAPFYAQCSEEIITTGTSICKLLQTISNHFLL